MNENSLCGSTRTMVAIFLTNQGRKTQLGTEYSNQSSTKNKVPMYRRYTIFKAFYSSHIPSIRRKYQTEKVHNCSYVNFLCKYLQQTCRNTHFNKKILIRCSLRNVDFVSKFQTYIKLGFVGNHYYFGLVIISQLEYVQNQAQKNWSNIVTQLFWFLV